MASLIAAPPSYFQQSRSLVVPQQISSAKAEGCGFNFASTHRAHSYSSSKITKAASRTATVSPVDSSSSKSASNPIVVIDNYDSFTYNLCQYMGWLGCEFEVYRNDELTVDELKGKNPRGVLISPGPGTPQDSGISLQTVLELGPTVPLFGVCMGLQCMGEAYGGVFLYLYDDFKTCVT